MAWVLDPAVAKAKAEMARDPKLRKFARETHARLVYKQAASKAPGHAEFHEIVRGMG